MEVVAVDHNYVFIDLKYVQVFMIGLQPLVKTKQLALRLGFFNSFTIKRNLAVIFFHEILIYLSTSNITPTESSNSSIVNISQSITCNPY
jgi:hypothetical protein